jgi:hypothetical protein
MAKATIIDIILKERVVDIPIKCPHCGADLTEEGALTVWEYQAQNYHARVEVRNNEEDVIDTGDMNEGADIFYVTGYKCSACDKYVHEEGKEVFIDTTAAQLFDHVVEAVEAKRGKG